ncbi:MAG TPA: hypothetical protein VLA72_13210 [Anaerolineales bacterium]|nr:hypothetical protein [Anaerolineales bacterium]
MKNRNALPVLLAVLALMVSMLACNFGAEPGVSDLRMVTDESGETNTTSYSPSEDFFVFFDVTLIDVGTYFEAEWYALDIEGEDPNTPYATIEYNLEEGANSVYFQLFNDSDWPVGTYRVEVYMEGVKVGEQQFSVR